MEILPGYDLHWRVLIWLSQIDHEHLRIIVSSVIGAFTRDTPRTFPVDGLGLWGLLSLIVHFRIVGKVQVILEWSLNLTLFLEDWIWAEMGGHKEIAVVFATGGEILALEAARFYGGWHSGAWGKLRWQNLLLLSCCSGLFGHKVLRRFRHVLNLGAWCRSWWVSQSIAVLSVEASRSLCHLLYIGLARPLHLECLFGLGEELGSAKRASPCCRNCCAPAVCCLIYLREITNWIEHSVIISRFLLVVLLSRASEVIATYGPIFTEHGLELLHQVIVHFLFHRVLWIWSTHLSIGVCDLLLLG